MRVLVAGAEAPDRERYRGWLEGERGCRYELVAADGAREALALLSGAAPIDCVLLSHGPRLDALALLASLAGGDGRVRVPVIVLEEHGSDVVAVAAMRAGAQDYAAHSRLTPEGLARSVRNAIEKVALQAALDAAQQQQLEMKDHLISHVSHELRTPLTAIHQFVTILIDEVAGPLAPQQREYLDIVLRNARVLRDMIEDLMDATRCDSGKLLIEPRVVPLADAARDCVASLRASAAAKQLRIELECEPDLPPVVADPLRLRQILGNLLDNAIKFTPAGRRIRVELARCARAPGCVAAAVRDEGCGIRAEHIPLVFERLHQEPAPELGSRRGLGLGLYISRELVLSQGGQIWAESELGRGSCFRFSLPVFSLEALLRRPLDAGILAPGPLFLVCVRVAPRPGFALDDEKLSAVYFALARLVYRESDIVLPRLPACGDAEHFHVIAATDRAGAESMTGRLQVSIERSEALDAAGMAIEVRAHAVAGALDGADPERWLAAAAGSIAALLPAARLGEGRPAGL